MAAAREFDVRGGIESSLLSWSVQVAFRTAPPESQSAFPLVYSVPFRGLPCPCVQVLFETDDLATVLWAELLAVLLRYKRAEPYRTDRGRDDKGKGDSSPSVPHHS